MNLLILQWEREQAERWRVAIDQLCDELETPVAEGWDNVL